MTGKKKAWQTKLENGDYVLLIGKIDWNYVMYAGVYTKGC